MFEAIVAMILISHITLWIDDGYDQLEGVVKTGSVFCTEEIKENKFKKIDC